MNKRVLVAVLAVGCALLLAGCLGGDDLEDPPGNVTAEDVESDAVAAMEEVDTAQIDLELTVEGNEGVLFEGESETVVDRERRRMRMDATADPILQDATTVTQYTVNETGYVQTEGGWRQESVDPEFWESDPISAYGAMLEAGETELRGVTDFEGSEVYVLETDVTGEALSGLVGQQLPESGPVSGDALEDLTVEQYVDRETGHVRYLELSVETSALGTDGRATITLTTTLSEFDEPVDITVPPEATSD